jgi:hypothetical protein
VSTAEPKWGKWFPRAACGVGPFVFAIASADVFSHETMVAKKGCVDYKDFCSHWTNVDIRE